MSFNGSGTFQPYVPGNPVVTGTVISSTAFNATIQDIAAGLSNAVTRDGQSPLTANLPAAGRKITGLGAGVVAGDSLRFEQLFSQGTEQDIASAATVDIGGLNTTIARITGTTTITSFGTNYNGPRYVRFAGALLLTHNATTLILPGGANINTAAGDRAILTPVGNPSSGWQVLAYQKADGTAVSGAALSTDLASATGVLAISNGGTGASTLASAKTNLGIPEITPGLGNLLINGNFAINQRGYVSGAATSGANQYTLDRWRVVTSGQNLTFSASGNGNQITAPAGGVEQVVEALNVEGGTYVLNWTGTATATVNGVARTKGENFTLSANATATVRFIGGTVSRAQLELGTTPTPFEMRQIAEELALCQRYYVSMTGLLKTQYAASTLTTNIASVEFPVTMRASPTIALSNVGYTNGSGLSAGTTTPSAARLAATISSGGNMLVTFDLLANAEL